VDAENRGDDGGGDASLCNDDGEFQHHFREMREE
jgi:hypothetical protein